MLKKLMVSAAVAASCMTVSAANDVYGVVSQFITRSGPNNDHQVYFRMEVDKDYSSFEHCVEDRAHLIWTVDVESPVFDAQFDLLKQSYMNKQKLRVTGYSDVCDAGDVYSDKVYELSPYNWKLIPVKPTGKLSKVESPLSATTFPPFRPPGVPAPELPKDKGTIGGEGD